MVWRLQKKSGRQWERVGKEWFELDLEELKRHEEIVERETKMVESKSFTATMKAVVRARRMTGHLALPHPSRGSEPVGALETSCFMDSQKILLSEVETWSLAKPRESSLDAILGASSRNGVSFAVYEW